MMATLMVNELSNFKPFTSNFEGWNLTLVAYKKKCNSLSLEINLSP